MQEAFLHYLWRQQKIHPSPWKSTRGERLQLVATGHPNSNSGPDFKEARLYVDDILWAGQVEIHVRSSDWFRHRHQEDPAYANVILHVVYEEDQVVYHPDGRPIPCLELKGKFEEMSYWRYEQLQAQPDPIACSTYFASVEDLLKQGMMERMILSRLERKQQFLAELYQKNHGDWESVAYQALAYSLGLKVNAENFLRLARALPRKMWQGNSRELGALFFGRAGFLEAPQDDYQRSLAQEYAYLKHKWSLKDPLFIPWQYARMRPAAFPDRRLAMLVALLQREKAWHKRIVHWEGQAKGSTLFKIDLDPYWQHHYRLGQFTKQKLALQIAPSLHSKLVINFIVPYWTFYSQKTGAAEYKARALCELAHWGPEFNKIVRLYEQLGLTIRSAYDSQAVLEWYHSLCGPKKCLNCAIGNELLKE